MSAVDLEGGPRVSLARLLSQQPERLQDIVRIYRTKELLDLLWPTLPALEAEWQLLQQVAAVHTQRFPDDQVLLGKAQRHLICGIRRKQSELSQEKRRRRRRRKRGASSRTDLQNTNQWRADHGKQQLSSRD